MSVREPRLLGRLIKWLVVPLLLAAVGGFGVGPYLNKVGLPLPESIKPRQEAPPTVRTDPTDETAGSSKFGEPKIEVSVGPGKAHLRRHSRSLGSKSTHRRRRHKKTTAAPAPAPATGPGTTDAPPVTPPSDDATG